MLLAIELHEAKQRPILQSQRLTYGLVPPVSNDMPALSPFRTTIGSPRQPLASRGIAALLVLCLKASVVVIQFVSSVYLAVIYHRTGEVSWAAASFFFVGVDYVLGALLMCVRYSQDAADRRSCADSDNMHEASVPLMILSALLGLSGVYFVVYPWHHRPKALSLDYLTSPYRPMVEYRSSFSVLLTAYILMVDQVRVLLFLLLLVEVLLAIRSCRPLALASPAHWQLVHWQVLNRRCVVNSYRPGIRRSVWRG